jgi:hypothetical protein
LNGRQFGASSAPERSPAQPTSGTNYPPVSAVPERADRMSFDPKPVAVDERKASKSAPHARKHGSKRPITMVIVIIAVLVLAFVAWYLFGKTVGGLAGIDKSGYQAVFLTNGQTYFGKLQAGSVGYLKLSDVYYLDSQPSDAGTSSDKTKTVDNTTPSQNSLQLFKMTDATVIGPQDTMYISEKQVLLYENLKPDSKVAQSIQKYQQTHQ